MSELPPGVRRLPHRLQAVPTPRAAPTTAHQRARDSDDERKALVRAIAASPVQVQWLRDHVTKILMREAGLLEVLGDDEGADHLRRRAAAHRAGDTPLW